MNSSSSEQENCSIKDAFRISNNQKPQVLHKKNNGSNQSVKIGTADSFVKILTADSFIESPQHINSNFIQEECERTASFTLDQSEVTQYNQEIIELYQEISELKNDQKNLENQIGYLELKISSNLKDMHQSLTKSDFSSIITRIGGLQEKFSNRSKPNLSTEKLSDLFEKISNLEFEAERIKRENTEVETLYHQSLNEIYEKIEKLKVENKALTDIILSSPIATSPKHSLQREIKKKMNLDNSEKKCMHAEISLKKVIEEDKQDQELLTDIYNEKELLEQKQLKIENELREIPENSKSMANKKKKQTLENDYIKNQSRLEELNEKIQNF